MSTVPSRERVVGNIQARARVAMSFDEQLRRRLSEVSTPLVAKSVVRSIFWANTGAMLSFLGMIGIDIDTVSDQNAEWAIIEFYRPDITELARNESAGFGSLS